MLLFCEVVSVNIVEAEYYGIYRFGLEIGIRGPRSSIDRIENGRDSVSDQVHTAFSRVMPFEYYLKCLNVRVSVFTPDANWRTDLHELIKGKGITNQASGAIDARLWQGFRFRSATEIKIAEALDNAGVLFFPLPKARVALDSGHTNIEPDFVVCHEGRWGILEVDEEPFHLPERSSIEQTGTGTFGDKASFVWSGSTPSDAIRTRQKRLKTSCC